MPDRRHITDLRIALEGERRAITQAREARRHVGRLIELAVEAGVPYARIARVALKMRLGRAPTTQERQREADRLRQRRRRSVTGRHGNVVAATLNRHSSGVGSAQEEHDMSRLIRKTTTVEEFDADDAKHEPECAEDAEGAAEDEEEDEDEEEEEEDDEA